MIKKNYSKYLGILLLGIFLISLGSAFNPFMNIRSPSDLLENDWFIFVIVFLIVFAFVFISLSNVLTKRSTNRTFPWLTEKEFYKGPVIVISICVALLTAAAFVRRDIFYSYLGEKIGVWVLAMMIVVFAVLTIPFYKFLKLNLGGAAGLAFAGILAAIWFALNMTDIYNVFPSEMISSNLEEIYGLITSQEVLLIIIGFGIVSVIFSWIKKGLSS